ncbi:hypothetical protein PCE1_004463 [Barthelona sp. PCE]
MPLSKFIKAKYCDETTLVDENTFTDGKESTVVFDFVGQESSFTQMSNTLRLQDIGLSSLGEPIIEVDSDAIALLQSCKRLDLADNQLSWRILLDLIKNLPGLREIYCAHCQFTDSPSDFVDETFTNSTITSLVFNSSSATGSDIEWVIKSFTSLRSLYIADLKLQNLTVTETHNMTMLVLSKNELTSPALDFLHFFPKLDILYLDNNPAITTLDPTALPKVRLLLLSQTAFDDWESVVAMRESLSELKVVDCPLIKNRQDRSFLVALMPYLRKFNGGEILRNERRDAEVLFVVRSFELDDDQIEDYKREALERLSKKHDINRDHVATKAATSQRTIIELGLQNNSVTGDMTSVTKKLPDTMTVDDLKTLAGALFKIDTAAVCVRYIAPGERIPEELMVGTMSLKLCAVSDGGRIVFDDVY